MGYVTKKSCIACVTKMTIVAVCDVCKEGISWRYSRCTKMEYITYGHKRGELNSKRQPLTHVSLIYLDEL
jgi:hypothetical protein